VGQLGLEIHLSDYVVQSVSGAASLRTVWEREVRWCRCIRVSCPPKYPGLLLTMTTPMALVFLAASGFGASGWIALASCLAFRWLIAWLIAGYTGDQESRTHLALVPIRDILSALVWCAGAVGRGVSWRGERFVLSRDGRMKPALGQRHVQGVSKRKPHHPKNGWWSSPDL
jgi:ceramide glucosyltransferase